METKEQFVQLFSATYDGTPWYGKSICRILEGVGAGTAFRQPPGSPHTIARLVAHMIAWKQVLVDRLEKNGNPKPRQKETFLTAPYGSDPETAWENLKAKLDRQQRELIQLLQFADPAKPEKPGKTEKLPLRLLFGVLQHDAYHLGQIALLKKELNS